MLLLAEILARIIEQHQGPGIWEAEWAKGYVEKLSEMKEYGRGISVEAEESLTPAETSKEILKTRKRIWTEVK